MWIHGLFMFKVKKFIVTSVLRPLAKCYQCNYKIPWLLSGKEFAYNIGAVGSICGSGRSPGEKKKAKQSTSVFLLGKSHGPRSLVGYSSWGCKE